MVTHDQAGPAMPSDERRELPCDTAARDRGVDHGGKTFLHDIVDHVEDPEPPTLGRTGRAQSRPTSARSARPPSGAAPACQSPSFVPVVCEPTGPPRGRASGSSCGSRHGPPGAAVHAASGNRTGTVWTPAPAVARAVLDLRGVGRGIGSRSGPRRSWNTPAARSAHGALRGSRRLRAWRRASPLSRQEVLQRSLVEQRLLEEPLQPDILLFQRLKPLRVRHVHAAELGFPGVECRAADAVPSAELRRLRTVDVYVNPAPAGCR